VFLCGMMSPLGSHESVHSQPWYEAWGIYVLGGVWSNARLFIPERLSWDFGYVHSVGIYWYGFVLICTNFNDAHQGRFVLKV